MVQVVSKHGEITTERGRKEKKKAGRKGEREEELKEGNKGN